MKGERKSAVNNQTLLPFFFQRRTERLDWRKIASLDLEKVVQDGDIEQLDEFTTPILFCRADSEFDENKTDPGFIKVFKLCQLIGEYLTYCHEKDTEKVTNCEKRCAILEELKSKGDEEIGQMRESLTLVKRELKKTKDILASTQTQLLGSDNLDEVDQCPYCSKTFLSPSLLLAHLHRRHQGLSIPASLQPQTTAANVMFPLQLQTQGSSSTTFSPINLGRGLGGTPTVYAFTLSPDGTVTRNQNQAGGTATNLNFGNISPSFGPENNNHLVLERRRDSATQTTSQQAVNAMGKKETTESGNDQNGNERLLLLGGSSAFSKKEAKSNSDSDPLLLVIKSPCGNSNDSDSDKEQQQPRQKRNRDREQDASSQIQTSGLDLNMICDLVEKYLEQRSVSSQNQHYEQILKSIYSNMDQFQEFAQNRQSPIPIENPQVDSSSQQHQQQHQYLKSSVASSEVVSSSASPSGPTTVRPVPQLTQSDANAEKSGGGNVDVDKSIKDFERIEKNVMRMTDEFETKWTHLSEKVRESGIEELRQAFLVEIKKVQEMILNSPHSQPPQTHEIVSTSSREKDSSSKVGSGGADHSGAKVQDNNKSMGPIPIVVAATATSMDGDKELKVKGRSSESSGGSPEVAVMDEHFRKLSDDLQSKMTNELQEMKKQLESQDQFWRSKLQTIEQQHQTQIEKLHNDFAERTKIHTKELELIQGTKRQESFTKVDDVFRPPSRYRKNVDKDGLDADISYLTDRGPIAKPRKYIEQRNEEHPPFQPQNHTISLLTVTAKDRRINDASKATIDSGGGESISIIRDNPGINQPSSLQMYQEYYDDDDEEEEDSLNQDDADLDQGLISTDPDAEGDYLTIIHAEGDAEYLDHLDAPTTKPTTSALPPPRGSVRNAKLSGRREMMRSSRRKPQIREYQEDPLNVHNNIDEVSDYTLSTSAEEHLRVANNSQKSEDDDGESLSEEDDNGHDHRHDNNNDGMRERISRVRKKSESGGGGGNKLEERLSSPKKKYVFDSAQGKIIDASETRSQMDLVRDRIVLSELDTQMEHLGLDPASSSIGLTEMARALKHVKTEKRLMAEDDAQFESEFNNLKKNVKYEAARKSIQRKFEKYGPPNRKQQQLSRFSNILNKVKKSGSSWRQKVATAMKRKEDSPSKKSKEKAEDTDIKTTFFSKWGRKKKANKDTKENKTSDGVDVEKGETDSSDEEESSSDVEMPPYMTRSQPILLKRGGESGRKFKKRNHNSASEGEEEEEDQYFEEHQNILEIGPGPPPKYPVQQKNPKLKPRRANAPQPPGQIPLVPSNTSSKSSTLHGNLMSELRAKIDKKNHKLQSQSPLESPKRNKTTIIDSHRTSTPPPTKYKGPNFFVSGSPTVTTPNRTAVTSNGWSEETRERKQRSIHSSGGNMKLMGNRSPLLGQQAALITQEKRGISTAGNVNSGSNSKTPTRFSNAAAASAFSSARHRGGGESRIRESSHGSGSGLPPQSSTVDQRPQLSPKRKRSFGRSDDMRKGFRRKSSLPLSDEEENWDDEGRESQRNAGRFTLPGERKPDTGGRGHFASLQRHSAMTPSKTGAINNNNNIRRLPEGGKGFKTRSSTPPGYRSDTSAWDTEEEEEIYCWKDDDVENDDEKNATTASQGQSSSGVVKEYNYCPSSSNSNYDSRPPAALAPSPKRNSTSDSRRNPNANTNRSSTMVDNDGTNENFKMKMKESILRNDFSSDEQTSFSEIPPPNNSSVGLQNQQQIKNQSQHWQQQQQGFNYTGRTTSQVQQQRGANVIVPSTTFTTKNNNRATGGGGSIGEFKTVEVSLERQIVQTRTKDNNSWDSD